MEWGLWWVVRHVGPFRVLLLLWWLYGPEKGPPGGLAAGSLHLSYVTEEPGQQLSWVDSQQSPYP